MKLTDTLRELEAKATSGPWRKSTGNVGNGIEGYSGKKSTLYRDDGYRMVATYQSCEATGKYKEEEENQKANGDLIIYLRNHAQEIINLVEAAENIRDSHIPNIQQFTNEIEDACPEANEAICELRDALEEVLAALNKE
jgi:hypothetical protein